MYNIDRSADAQFVDFENRNDGRFAPSQTDRVLTLETAATVAVTEMKTGSLRALDTNLAALYFANSDQAVAMSAFTDSVQHFQQALAVPGYVLIDATATDGDGAALLAQLQAMGLEGGSSFRGVASGFIPVNALGELSSVSHISTARESAAATMVGLVTTQADQAMAVDTARNTTGLTGAGVKIGVISDSFNKANVVIGGVQQNFARDIATGDLLPTTKILQDYVSGTDEGRAMAQLVQDLAPGADITFATSNFGQAGFANNIIALAQAGNKVIVDDVRYYAELMYQNGPISQAVNQVVNENGVVYFSSAGNQSNDGWQGNWVSGGTYVSNGITYQLMNFGVPATATDGVARDYLQYTGAAGVGVLQWDEPGASAGGPGAKIDLDVFITNQDGSVLYRAAASNNIGGDPVEAFSTLAATTTTSALPARRRPRGIRAADQHPPRGLHERSGKHQHQHQRRRGFRSLCDAGGHRHRRGALLHHAAEQRHDA